MTLWFKPPRNLLVILFLLTLVSILAFAWLGWKLLEQERAVEAQRVQERLQQAADRIAATLRQSLAETGERLGAWAASPPAANTMPNEGLLLILSDATLSAFPPARLLYHPVASRGPEASPATFAAGEALEFLKEQPDKAAEWYSKLADSADVPVRAGALMRLGRVLRKSGQIQASSAAYTRLSALRGVCVAGAPAELVGRHATGQAEALRKDLLAGRWTLSRGQFAFYWSEVAGRESPPAEAAGLAEAVAEIWAGWKRDPTPRGQRIIWTEGQPSLALWRSAAGREAALVAKPESILAMPGGSALVDAEGRLIAGRKGDSTHAVIRTTVETQLPWTLYVTDPSTPAASGLRARQRFVLLALAVMVLFLIAGSYFIARAIRKEMEVSRLQSDFVSAVSHEFRSPLTSMRQLSEILAFGRLPNEERRQKYYDTLVSETRRLQGLVETLLNFGKMEAGARRYRFEDMDAGDLVERVVGEFEPSGRKIEVNGAVNPCAIEADPEALSLALRNLVDNALKYSQPDQQVQVEWGPENGRLAIRVRDKGMGIAMSERKAIFEKFVRGSAAVAANVKGTGVGLAMVRHVVAAHGGEIQVESEPGLGSTFTMFLPRRERQKA